MTKNNPGPYDCHANAEPDEPMFTLLARDVTAQYFVAAWVSVRCGDVPLACKLMDDAAKELRKVGKPIKEWTDPKMIEAAQCSQDMRMWLLGKQLDAIEKRLECAP